MTMIGEPTAIVPDKGIRGSYNGGATALVEAIFVDYSSGATPNAVGLPTAGGRAKGVTMELIQAGYYGDVQIEGKAIVLAASQVLIGEHVKTDANGYAAKATSGTYELGICVAKGTATGTLRDLLEVELHKVPHIALS